jgi:hypothetical protein
MFKKIGLKKKKNKKIKMEKKIEINKDESFGISDIYDSNDPRAPYIGYKRVGIKWILQKEKLTQEFITMIYDYILENSEYFLEFSKRMFEKNGKGLIYVHPQNTTLKTKNIRGERIFDFKEITDRYTNFIATGNSNKIKNFSKIENIKNNDNNFEKSHIPTLKEFDNSQINKFLELIDPKVEFALCIELPRHENLLESVIFNTIVNPKNIIKGANMDERILEMFLLEQCEIGKISENDRWKVKVDTSTLNVEQKECYMKVLKKLKFIK